MRRFLVLAAGALMACSSHSEPSKSTPITAMDLAGSEWNMGNESNAFVAFKSDGSIVGNGGCNAFFGKYTQDDNTVSIGPLGSTRKLCSPDIMSIEDTLMGALDKTVSVNASHLKLTLIDLDGEEILKLQRSDWD